MSKGITFFKEDRQPTPDNPNEIISTIVDDEVADYINRLEKYKNNWEELNKWVKKVVEISNILDKMKELEEDK